MTRGQTSLSLPDLRAQCCRVLHVCFEGDVSDETIAGAREQGCVYGTPPEVFAFTNYRRSGVAYVARMRIVSGSDAEDAWHFAVDVSPGEVKELIVTDDAGPPHEPTHVRPLGPTRFADLGLTCVASAGATTVHAEAGFSFPWTDYTTFIELPNLSPDEQFALRGVRIADAEDGNYVILDVPGPGNETITATCSLGLELDAYVDENLLWDVLEKVQEHLGPLVSPRGG